jgi:formylglycine-generating enzyme required for sulfatase activity
MHMNIWSFFDKELAHWVTVPMALLCLVLMIGACGDEQGPVGHETSNEEVSVGIALSKIAVSVVARAELVVTADDIDPITAPLDIVDDRLVGSVVVPTGSDRLFTINAYDAAGALIYTGQARADVVPGSGTDLPRIAVGRVEAPSDLPPVVTKTAPNEEALRFLLVPKGYFTMGDDLRENDGPAHAVYLDDYYIAEYEVTVGQFVAFLNERGNDVPTFTYVRFDGSKFEYKNQKMVNPDQTDDPIKISGDDFVVDPERSTGSDYPVTAISWWGARLFCERIGARLPTEAEWEKAGRGPDGRRFSWGNTWYFGHARSKEIGNSLASSIGTHPNDVSYYGAFDMTGNVREWVNDWADYSYYYYAPGHNPPGPLPAEAADFPNKIIKGGWYDSHRVQEFTLSRRELWGIVSLSPTVGFRCATDPN